MADDALSLRKHRRAPLFPPEAPAHTVNYGRAEIEFIIPHREPFMLLDQIVAVDTTAGLIAGRRRVRKDDPVFAGHFPDYPVYPGVLLVEMLGQLGCCLLYFLERRDYRFDPLSKPLAVRATKIKAALFAAPVPPGAELTLLGRSEGWDGLIGGMIGQIMLGDKICCALSGELCVVG